MSKWVVDEGDSCPKCGAPIEVLVDEDSKFDTEKGSEFPKAERCTKCDWEHELQLRRERRLRNNHLEQ